MKKRLVAFLLVLIMVLGMLPVSAMAAGSVVTARGSAENPIRIYENSGNQAETSNAVYRFLLEKLSPIPAY